MGYRNEKMSAFFEQVMLQIQNDETLNRATQDSISRTKFYAADDYPPIERSQGRRSEVCVTKSTTFDAARRLHAAYPEKRIAVLNFASAVNPGGGVTFGATAQEECLCRCSTLYPTLNQPSNWEQYYNVNRANDSVLYSDACIFSPDVIVFKRDADIPADTPASEWFAVDVITCAAPKLRRTIFKENAPAIISPEELYKLHVKRAQHILTVAAANKADILVLGAFGCGAFANDPHVVSRAMFDALEGFEDCFDLVEFAVFCRSYETVNYDVFYEACQNRHTR